MDEDRLHSHRTKLIGRVSGLLRERDLEIQRYGAARERTAQRIIIADGEVREIERELASRTPREASS